MQVAVVRGSLRAGFDFKVRCQHGDCLHSYIHLQPPSYLAYSSGSVMVLATSVRDVRRVACLRAVIIGVERGRSAGPRGDGHRQAPHCHALRAPHMPCVPPYPDVLRNIYDSGRYRQSSLRNKPWLLVATPVLQSTDGCLLARRRAGRRSALRDHTPCR